MIYNYLKLNCTAETNAHITTGETAIQHRSKKTNKMFTSYNKSLKSLLFKRLAQPTINRQFAHHV